MPSPYSCYIHTLVKSNPLAGDAVISVLDDQPQKTYLRAHRTPRPRFQMARIVTALMLREMATTYGKSAGGYLWAVVEPVLGIGLLSVIFSLSLNSPGLGTNFPLFYATGFLPFMMFNEMASKVATSIRFSQPFMAYPGVTFLDAMVARALLNVLTHCSIIAIVMTGIFVIFQLPADVNFAAVVAALGMVSILGLGIGTVNCYLFMAFPIWERAWSILTRPLFLISGLFFTYDMLPTAAQDVLWFNPLIHCIGMMRSAFYPTYEGAYISMSYVFGVSIVLIFFGLLLLLRKYRDLMEG